MTTEDFSIEFDILYNNINSNQSPGLSEYEKSILLTEAQELLYKAYYSGTSIGNSFENTEQITSYLSSAVKELNLKYIGIKTDSIGTYYYFDIPNQVWFITLEKAVIDTSSLNCNIKESTAEVIPVKQDDFFRTVKSPFRGASKGRVLRLTYSNDNYDRASELVSKYPVNNYIIKYLEKPQPIVLEDGIEIDGITYNAQTSKLPEPIHREILLKAVELAKSVWA